MKYRLTSRSARALQRFVALVPLVAGAAAQGQATIPAAGPPAPVDDLGIVRGAVVIAGGASPEGVAVMLRAPGLLAGTRTRADGSFELPRVKAGTVKLAFARDDLLPHELEDLAVRGGSETEVGEVELRCAPSIAGIVVDERGRPLAAARIEGFAVRHDSSRLAVTRTDARGRFVLVLHHDVPHKVVAFVPGYAEQGYFDVEATPPGTSDLRILVEPEARTTFVIVDAETQLPIEDAAIAVVSGASGAVDLSSLVERAAAPRGIATRFARPGVDRFVAFAPGYASRLRSVEWNAKDGRSVVRLERESTLSGTLRGGDGGPLPGVELRVRSGDLRRHASTAADGAFSVSGLAAGRHLLIAVAEGRGAAVREITLRVGEIAAPLELRLEPAARIEGLALANDRTHRLESALLDEPLEIAIDGAGKFVVEDLPPGDYLLEPLAIPLTLRSGETRRLVIE
jgi:hypothetical protein